MDTGGFVLHRSFVGLQQDDGILLVRMFTYALLRFPWVCSNLIRKLSPKFHLNMFLKFALTMIYLHMSFIFHRSWDWALPSSAQGAAGRLMSHGRPGSKRYRQSPAGCPAGWEILMELPCCIIICQDYGGIPDGYTRGIYTINEY